MFQVLLHFLIFLFAVQIYANSHQCTNQISKQISEQVKLEDNEIISGCYLAELNGKAPKEAVLYVQKYEGEGVLSYDVLVFSLKSNPPEMLIRKETHGEYLSKGYLSITDMDKDGKNEIFIVGDTDGYKPSDIVVYEWANGHLSDKIYSEDTGTSYFNYDIDNDSEEEIISLSFSTENEQNGVIILKKDNSGYYTKQKKQNFSSEQLVKFFLHIIKNNLSQRVEIDYPIFTYHLRKIDDYRINFDELQTLFQSKYRSAQKNQKYFIELMGLKGNSQAPAFLKSIIEKTSKWELKLAAIQSLLYIDSSYIDFVNQGIKQFISQTPIKPEEMKNLIQIVNTVSDEKVSDYFLDMIENKSDVNSKIELIASFLFPINQKLTDHLVKLLLTDSSIEIKRTSAKNLSELKNKQLTINTKDILAGLKINDSELSSYLAILISKLDRKELIDELILQLDQTKNATDKSRLIKSLYELNSNKGLDKIVQLLKEENEKELRNISHLFLSIQGIENSIKGLSLVQSTSELDIYSKFISENLNETVLSTLTNIIQTTKKSSLKRRCIEHLKHFQYVEVKELLKNLIETDDSEKVKIATIHVIGSFKNNDFEATLLNLLDSKSSPSIRNEIISAFGEVGGTKIEEMLIQMIESDYNENIVHALSKRKKSNIATLFKTLIQKEEEKLVQYGECLECETKIYHLSKGLFEINSESGLEQIKKQLKRNNYTPELIRFLANSGQKQVIESIKVYAYHSNRDVRIEVANALKKSNN